MGSQFEPAIQATELREGGYSNNPNDSGGETYRGISRHNFPLWTGWTIIDAARANNSNFPMCLDANTTLQALVIQFYRTNFWQYDAINDQAIANKLFDMAVNIGTVHAIRIVQMVLGVTVDGILGPMTTAAINSTSNGSLLSNIRAAAEEYYKQIVNTHPQDAIFLKGWLRRAAS